MITDHIWFISIGIIYILGVVVSSGAYEAVIETRPYILHSRRFLFLSWIALIVVLVIDGQCKPMKIENTPFGVRYKDYDYTKPRNFPDNIIEEVAEVKHHNLKITYKRAKK